VRIDVTGAGTQGENDERAVLRKTPRADRCYVMDRGYAQFSLFNAIAAIGGSYVCRVRDNSAYEVVEERPLSPKRSRPASRLTPWCAWAGIGKRRIDPSIDAFDLHPHHARMRNAARRAAARPGRAAMAVPRLATNLLDVPAEVIGFIYQRRWTIEIFFRFLKHILGCRHLLSTNRRGWRFKRTAPSSPVC